MSWTAPGTAVVGQVLTASFWNTNVRDELNAAVPVGKLDFFIMASAGYQVANVINGAWLECNGASVLRATYPAFDTLLAALSPARPFGTADGTHVTVPDLYGGRAPLHLGSNATVSTLGNSDGVAAANRRGSIHRHTPHSHTTQTYTVPAGGTTNAAGGGSFGSSSGTNTADGGSGTATDPLDGSAYQVTGIWAVKAL